MDARFIFLWIAFSALYGRAKYRESGDGRSTEFRDINGFLTCMRRLDNRAVGRALRDIGQDAGVLCRDKFLDNKCWQRWDEEGIVEKTTREKTCLSVNPPNPDLVTVFSRLYVLRNQMFHGCSKDGSSKNRPSLRAAVPVLERLVRTFITVVEVQSGGNPVFEKPPYPPSQ